jgi:hypothetical protein
MKRTSLFFLSALLAGGCMMPPRTGANNASGYTPSDETKAQVRDSEKKAYEQADAATDQQLDDLSKETQKALGMALGKESTAQGMPAPAPAADTIAELQKAKVKLRIEQVKDQNGNAVNNDFLQLKDSLTDRIVVLSKKIGEKKASKAEIKEVQEGAKLIGKLNDLKMQVMNASMAMMKSNMFVQTQSLQSMLRVSNLIRSHKLQSMDINADDIALVKRGLERERRAEAIAAVSMGLIAAYQGVANGNKDPKAVQIVAEKASEAFPLKLEVSDEDAKTYIDGLKGNVAKMKDQYESMLRKTYGDARYEQQMKAGIDSMFQQAANAEDQKSASQIADDAQKDWAKNHPEGAADASTPEVGGPFGKSLKGIQSLANGDPKGALEAAMDFVPIPGLKQGLGLALSLFG